MQSIVLFADTPLGTRLVVGGILVIFGILFAFRGMANVNSQSAEETGGARRGINWLLGRSNSYRGSTAVTMGVVRIIGGIIAIIAGIVFMILGPILA